MPNTLICCGGTGAHVALAFMRLHALGQQLGFFRSANGDEIELPEIYLVDQDDGDGEREPTAWQTLKKVIDTHPSAPLWGNRPDQPSKPTCHVVTPLPVGDGKWFTPPNDQLVHRFQGSPFLQVFSSPAQRTIRFSNGMMGSPALGSLLFRLKHHDNRPGGGNNNDRSYQMLRQRTGRIVVVGSGVGGTGASVGPTLANELAEHADVMAVMVLNWFKFTLDGIDTETADLSHARNLSMRQNANSALQYYGESLAEKVAAVPVGVPDESLQTRIYSSDMGQPACEAYPHGVAALCAIQHFTAQDPFLPGLYYMNAVDPTLLHGKTGIPERNGTGTLQDLANRAAALKDTLSTFGRVLRVSHKRRSVTPAIHQRIRNKIEDTSGVGDAVSEVVASYDEHLTWMGSVLGVRAVEFDGFTLESQIRDRLRHGALDLEYSSPKPVAAELARWTAEWVNAEAHDRNLGTGIGMPGGYHWPNLVDDDGGGLESREPGTLTRVPDEQRARKLQAFVNPDEVTEDGWPDPVAAADYFAYAIGQRNLTALRQLEVLLLALAQGKYELKRTPDLKEGTEAEVTLERLLRDRRDNKQGSSTLATHVLVDTAHTKVVGFNSPTTLLCPVPGLDDAFWNDLTASLTGVRGHWLDSGIDWGTAKTRVAGVKAWIDALKSRLEGDPPNWTHVFGDREAASSYGTAGQLRVLWGGREVEILLPSRESGNITRGTYPDTEETFHTEWREYQGYSVVDFEIPGEPRRTQGIWKGHLLELQKAGEILDFGSAQKQVYICVMREGAHKIMTVPNTVLLDRPTMMVRSFQPMRQIPVNGSTMTDKDLSPTLPLKSDYIGLVEDLDGRSLLHRLKVGDGYSVKAPEKSLVRDGMSQSWSLRMKGCPHPLTITLPMPAEESFHKAHWMVWPKFRAANDPHWRSYYVYEDCTDARLHIDTLWLDPDTQVVDTSNPVGKREPTTDSQERPEDPTMVRLTRNETGRFGSYRLQIDEDGSTHLGGPPLAFRLRNVESDEEHGIYLFDLDPIKGLPGEVQVGIDFGTSHTVAAVKTSAVGEPEPIEFAPELGGDGRHAISFHVSENREHVDAAFKDDGLLSLGVWQPTYVRTVEENLAGLLPSELLTVGTVDSTRRRDIGLWEPGRDVLIPPVGIARRDLGDHLISDFKWNSSSIPGYEGILREIYLSMVVELVMAEITARNGRPDSVQATFTYPLRSTDNDVDDYRTTLQKVMLRATKGLGSNVGLHDDIGLYDESHAAKGGTGTSGDVCVVGDLGGGTLDMLISAHGDDWDDMADSVRLGGNLLLRKLAERGGALPRGWGGTAEERETHLRAWMRAMGSPRLFGVRAGQPAHFRELDLTGFERTTDAERARGLINRYFYLIVEFMARNLVAYLNGHWFEKVTLPSRRAELNILIYLRGNSWRLWHETESYEEIEEMIGTRVRRRAEQLWSDLNEGPPFEAKWSFKHAEHEHPKRGPVKQVVGDSRPYEEIRDRWFSHALVDLSLVKEAENEKIPWHTKVPFRTGGAGVRVQFNGIAPPIHLSSQEATQRVQLTELEAPRQRAINNKLDKQHSLVREGLYYLAPIAAWVWEEAFDSDGFWN